MKSFPNCAADFCCCTSSDRKRPWKTLKETVHVPVLLLFINSAVPHIWRGSLRSLTSIRIRKGCPRDMLAEMVSTLWLITRKFNSYWSKSGIGHVLTNLLKTVCFGLFFAILPKFNKNSVCLHISVNVAAIGENSLFWLLLPIVTKLNGKGVFSLGLVTVP